MVFEFNGVNIAAPCSVKAKGKYFECCPLFKVTNCDLQSSNSSFVNSNIKSSGKRLIFRFTGRCGRWGQPLTYDNLSKSLHTFPLGVYHSLLSFKTSGLLWPLRKSSAFFILYPRCSDSNPSNTCNKCHMSRADPKSLENSTTFLRAFRNQRNSLNILSWQSRRKIIKGILCQD